MLGGHLEDHDAGAGGSNTDGLGRRLEGYDRLCGLSSAVMPLAASASRSACGLWRSHPHARLCATG